MRWMNVDDDGKKTEIESKSNDQDFLNSVFILFDTNKTNYNYTFKKLQPNKRYSYKLYLYKEKNVVNQNHGFDPEFVIKFDKSSLSFTTNRFDFEDKHFSYSHDYDTNGICYFLGTNYDQNKWINPAISNKIKLKSSGWYKGSINDMVERTPKCSFSSSVKNSWITFNFGDIAIKPTHYTLRHYENDSYYIKKWNILGSSDSVNWEIINSHSHWISPFGGPGKSKTFKVKTTKYYKYFKIQMSGRNSSDNWCITINGFEIYGYIWGNKN